MKYIQLLLILLLLSGCQAVQPKNQDSFATASVGYAGTADAADLEQMPAAENSFIKALADDRVAQLGAHASQGESAVRDIYHYLVENIYFTNPVGLDVWQYYAESQQPVSYLENRALSPLLFQIGSCEDFAAALVLLLRSAGFEAEYVAGYTLSVDQVYIDHAWAMVQLDGAWYHLDPQLEQNVTRDNRLTYRYYLRSDEEMEADHKWGENLIAYWPDIPKGEQEQIRLLYTPPLCPAQYKWKQPLQAQTIPLPQKPNMADLEADIAARKRQGKNQKISAVRLNVEPPILVAKRHITPPLLSQTPLLYGRSQLDSLEQTVYDALEYAAQTHGVSVSSKGLTNLQLKRVVAAFSDDLPQYYWVQWELPPDDSQTIFLRYRNGLDREKVEERQRQIDAKTDCLLADTADMTEFETALYIYDYLTSSVVYQKEQAGKDGGNIYGALVQEKAFCDGYSKAFQYLAGKAGVEAVYIRGTSLRGVPHSWNAVCVDGVWYYADPTWGRPQKARDGIYHDFFLMKVSEMERERFWDSSQYIALPQSADEGQGYYERMGYFVQGPPYESGTAKIAQAFYKQLKEQKEYPQQMQPVYLELKVVGTRQEYQQWKSLFVGEIFEILLQMDQMAAQDGLEIKIRLDESVECDFNDSMQVVTCYPKIERQGEQSSE